MSAEGDIRIRVRNYLLNFNDDLMVFELENYLDYHKGMVDRHKAIVEHLEKELVILQTKLCINTEGKRKDDDSYSTDTEDVILDTRESGTRSLETVPPQTFLGTPVDAPYEPLRPRSFFDVINKD